MTHQHPTSWAAVELYMDDSSLGRSVKLEKFGYCCPCELCVKPADFILGHICAADLSFVLVFLLHLSFILKIYVIHIQLLLYWILFLINVNFILLFSNIIFYYFYYYYYLFTNILENLMACATAQLPYKRDTCCEQLYILPPSTIWSSI